MASHYVSWPTRDLQPAPFFHKYHPHVPTLSRGDWASWLPAKKTWKRMIWTAGFEDVSEHGTFTVTIPVTGGTRKIPHVVYHARGTAPRGG